MKPASFSIAILSFFSRHGQYFHPTKDQPRTRPASPFLYICCNFGQIFCTNIIQFFSVENMGHNQLRKCSKYHLVSLLNEKQRSTFAIFLHIFYPCPLLNNSAMGNIFCLLSYNSCKRLKLSVFQFNNLITEQFRVFDKTIFLILLNNSRHFLIFSLAFLHHHVIFKMFYVWKPFSTLSASWHLSVTFCMSLQEAFQSEWFLA